MIIKIPRPTPIVLDREAIYRYEWHLETSSNESLAYDNSVLLIINDSSLGHIQTTLDNFARISDAAMLIKLPCCPFLRYQMKKSFGLKGQVLKLGTV
jgi:hypothetical protein